MAVMTGGESVVLALKENGVDTVFGIIGVQMNPIYDALYNEPGIKHITVRHEQCAAYMADAYARVTGRLGVTLTIGGPGVCNALTGIGRAYAGSSPVLLISSGMDFGETWQGRGVIHEMDNQLGVVAPLVKWGRRVELLEEIPSAIHEAVAYALSGRTRPVYLEIPAGVLSSKAEIEITKGSNRPKPKGDAEKVLRLATALLRARKPLVWAGGGVARSGATDELVALAEFLQTPVMTTVSGKGAIPDDHYLCQGASHDFYGPELEIAQEADLVLAVGTRLMAATKGPLGLIPVQNLFQIDIDESQIGKSCPVKLGIVGDAKEVLSQLLVHLRTTGQPRPSRKQELESIKTERREALRERGSVKVSALEEVRSLLDRDAVVFADLTMLGTWADTAFEVYQARTYHSCTYFGTIGFALPSAIGAKVAQPERQVVALTGDGGFLANCQELATAIQYGVKIVVIIANDDCYGAPKEFQRRKGGGRFIGVDLVNPDFVKLAEAFGVRGVRINGLSDLGTALKDALNADKATVIEVPVHGISQYAPAWDSPDVTVPGEPLPAQPGDMTTETIGLGGMMGGRT